MLLKCIGNNVSTLASEEAKARIKNWTNSEGEYIDLEIGRAYIAQAVEHLDGGIFYYLHSVDVSEHPYPYAVEFFEIEDSSIPTHWEVSFKDESGIRKFNRLSFPEWANDDLFFE